MPETITALTLGQLAQRYRDGALDPVGVTEAYLDAIAAHPDGAKVYRVVTAERALRQARAAQRLFERGVDLGPLQGVPLAIKDLVDTAGEVSASGSKVLAERPPAAQDAPVAARLDAAGTVFLGRTNMTELAYSGLGLNPHYGTPGAAPDRERVPGGSSSGSGVAVASGLAAVAVGSDTGGSVRIPAAVNGVVGLKTTDGRIPTEGCVPLSTTLDTLGPMARTVDDAWEVIDEISADGDVLALALCDHRMPGTTGVEFLVDMMDDDRTAATRKVLVTGQAQLEDTIVAVNEADLDHYIAKPWDRADLEATVRDQLTSYVADMGIDPLPHLAALDQARAMDLIR